MKLKQRALTLLLSLAMMVTFMPAMALAEGDESSDQGGEVTTVDEGAAAEETVDIDQDTGAVIDADDEENSDAEILSDAGSAKITAKDADDVEDGDEEWSDTPWYYIDIESESGYTEFFSDGDLALKLSVDADESEIAEYLTRCSLKYTVEYDPQYDEEESWTTLENTTDITYYTDNGINGITLHGAQMWDAVKDLDSRNKNDLRVSVSATIEEDGESVEIGSGSTSAYIYKAGAYYYLEDEESEYLTGEWCWFSKTRRGEVYSTEYPYGEYFEYEITAVKVNGEEVPYDSEDESYGFEVKAGENRVEITHQKYDMEQGSVSEDETETETVVITGADEAFYLDIDSTGKYDLLPGEEVEITARGSRSTLGNDGEYVDDYSGFKYASELTEGSDLATITAETASDNSWYKVTLKLNEDIDFDEIEDSDIRVDISLVDPDSEEVLRNDYLYFSATTEYTELKLDKEIDGFMAVGDSVTVTPAVYLHKYEDGVSTVTARDDVSFAFDFDPDEVAIQGEVKVGSQSGYVDIEPDIDDSERHIYGGFKSYNITRNTKGYTGIALYAYEYNEDKEWSEVAYRWIDFDTLLDFENPEVTGITNRTYNGKAQTQTVTVEIDDPWGSDERYTLKEGEDYKLAYKNNINAGTATVEIVGINEFSGASISKTFTIAKAAQNPSVTAKTKTVKVKKVKKKKQTVAPLTVKNAQGTVTYTGVGTNKKSKKALSINKKTGKITVKKKTKKGTYKMKVTVKAAGNNNYNAKTVTKTVTVKVK